MNRFWKGTLLALGAVAFAGAAWVTYQWNDIPRTWRSAAPAASDAAIILGAGAWNGQPSPALRERLDVAVDLWKGNLTTTFICTGGIGNDPRSEASVCADYLQARGIPRSQIILEEQSASTWENLANARPLLAERKLNTVLIVTHGFHLKRALIQARDLGISASLAPVRNKPINERYLLFREVAALTYYYLGGRERVNIFRWSVVDR